MDCCLCLLKRKSRLKIRRFWALCYWKKSWHLLIYFFARASQLWLLRFWGSFCSWVWVAQTFWRTDLTWKNLFPLFGKCNICAEQFAVATRERMKESIFWELFSSASSWCSLWEWKLPWTLGDEVGRLPKWKKLAWVQLQKGKGVFGGLRECLGFRLVIALGVVCVNGVRLGIGLEGLGGLCLVVRKVWILSFFNLKLGIPTLYSKLSNFFGFLIICDLHFFY